ncbi:DUF4367 domain-containing protein [Bacillus yapensis]|uniref:DUF4367 domain-containing protein n=1 Tax=Bacillus yapensis TaxID=2492960 RepID=UPI001FEA2948|nr:DUF4367 domain-containing protein [Bacillus yapensis]
MTLKTTLLLVFFLQLPLFVQAKEIEYNHNSFTLSEIKEKVDFSVLSPEKIPDDWTLEIKTYPMEEVKNFTHFRLHYMNKDDTYFHVGIKQQKETTKLKEPITPNTEKVKINGNRGFFTAWGNSGELDKKGELITGGILRWSQDGTIIEMLSTSISKEMMLEIASSMQVIK